MVRFSDTNTLFLLSMFLANFVHSIVLNDSDGPRLDPQPIVPDQPLDICVLPDGSAGKATLLEDCNHIDLLNDSPPETIVNYRGSTLIICCPMPVELFTGIVFPDELQEFYDEVDDYDFLDYYQPGADGGAGVEVQTKSEVKNRCELFSPATKCMDLEECGNEDISGATPPVTCGWNMSKKRHDFCCKDGRQKSTRRNEQKSRERVNRKYDCEDMHAKCTVWANLFPDSCTNGDHKSFPFMTIACMKSCNICQTKGCADEFSKCSKWRKSGFCSSAPDMMAVYCRNSCGTCGFNSPRNKENQIKGGRSFTNLGAKSFFCGEGKLLEKRSNREILSRGKERRRRQAEDEEEFKLFHYATELENSPRGIRCGTVIINDRFALFAAHCYTNFGTPASQENTLTVILRDGTEHEENIEVRRVFVHPEYKFPSLYYDIALVELGRRIEYDYSIFGDSPACLGSGSGRNLEGRRASSEGYGFTENGVTSSVLLTTNVTIIGNEECARYLQGNTTDKPVLRERIRSALADGLNEQLVCSTGDFSQETGAYSGPCEGDSGGPLYVNYGSDSGRRFQTVEGIVSGGIACGKNVPSWYTKVSSFRDWILCMIREIKLHDNRSKAEQNCRTSRKQFIPRNLI